MPLALPVKLVLREWESDRDHVALPDADLVCETVHEGVRDVVEDGEMVNVCDGVVEILPDDVGDLEKVMETEPVSDGLVE